MSKYGKTIRDKLTWPGRAVYATRAARFYHDGDGAGFVWRWWHPLAWVFAPVLLSTGILIEGLPKALRYRHEYGFGMKPWFVEHPERLEWE